jgi:hypothetical protein
VPPALDGFGTRVLRWRNYSAENEVQEDDVNANAAVSDMYWPGCAYETV